MLNLILTNCTNESEQQAFLTHHNTLKQKQQERGRSLMTKLRTKHVNRQVRRENAESKIVNGKIWTILSPIRITPPYQPARQKRRISK